eukprot:4842581-Amphidinium_carterae.1
MEASSKYPSWKRPGVPSTRPQLESKASCVEWTLLGLLSLRRPMMMTLRPRFYLLKAMTLSIACESVPADYLCSTGIGRCSVPRLGCQW